MTRSHVQIGARAACALCKNLQAESDLAGSNGSERARSMTADPDSPGSAIIGHCFFKLEGLAVAIPWGFESPLPHQQIKAPLAGPFLLVRTGDSGARPSRFALGLRARVPALQIAKAPLAGPFLLVRKSARGGRALRFTLGRPARHIERTVLTRAVSSRREPDTCRPSNPPLPRLAGAHCLPATRHRCGSRRWCCCSPTGGR